MMRWVALSLATLTLVSCSSPQPAETPSAGGTPTESARPTDDPTRMSDFPPAAGGGGGGGTGGGGDSSASSSSSSSGPGGSSVSEAPRTIQEWKPRDPRSKANFDKAFDQLPGYQEAVALTNTVPATPSNLKKGQGLWIANCAPCHGDLGQGDGPSSRLLKEPVRDLSDPWLYKFGATDQALYRSIAYGLPGSVMGVFKGVLKEDEIWSLVNYLKSLQKKG